jgi:hypothetical protein
MWCGRPPVDARRLLCVGFRQCGLIVEVCVVGCVLTQGRGLVLVWGDCACRAVCGGRAAGAALVAVRQVESTLREGCLWTTTGVSQHWFSGHFRQVFFKHQCITPH